MGRKFFGFCMLMVAVTISGYSQSGVSSSIGLVNSDVRADQEVEYIDNDGIKGRLMSYTTDASSHQYVFISMSEIGEIFESYVVQNDELVEVIVRKTDYNRPKFWTEPIARANDDDQWFDPEKSVTEEVTYYFKDGQLASFENLEGDNRYAITGSDERREKLIRKRYGQFSKALRD